MTEQLRTLISRLEQYIEKACERNDQYDFATSMTEISDALEQAENNFEAIGPILELIERNPDLNYGAPGPLAHFMEAYYKKGYEELLVNSIKRKPTEYTLFLLHRVMNDTHNPNHLAFLDLMKKVSLNKEYPENIIDQARDSLTYFQ